MNSAAPTTHRNPRWPWVVLALGLCWTAALRVPVLLNASEHLDSDLAVDGLTLLEAVEGRWRWHYPGTPHMGILPVLMSYPQALILGANPITLVSGGLVAWLLVVLVTFWLAWRGFGPRVAGWSILPLVFSSVGTVWLSSRITGGHLLTLVWHIGALLGLFECLERGGRARAGLLGLWCGLGLYLDTMFLFALAGLVPSAVAVWWARGHSKAGLLGATAFLLGLAMGVAPQEIGRRVDPYDPYHEQFAPILKPEALAEHGRILVLECLPRLIAGYELPDLRATPEALSPNGRPVRVRAGRGSPHPLASLAIALTLGMFAASIIRLGRAAFAGDAPRRAVAQSALISSALIAIGFLINRNIFNSDNYRYLVFLLIPWALGFGQLLGSLSQWSLLGRVAAVGLATALAVTMTASVIGWWVGLGWLESGGGATSARPRTSSWRAVTVPVRSERGAVMEGKPYRIPPEATHLYGDYWDVYRLAFLSGGRVTAAPFPIYPNRFEGWSRGLGPDEGALAVLDPRPGWRRMLAESWRREDRDPEELDQLKLLIP